MPLAQHRPAQRKIASNNKYQTKNIGSNAFFKRIVIAFFGTFVFGDNKHRQTPKNNKSPERIVDDYCVFHRVLD